MPGLMLYMTETDAQHDRQKEPEQHITSNSNNGKPDIADQDGGGQGHWGSYAASTGGTGNGNGIGEGKGYGECWHCGEWGHPRRECPKCLESKGSPGALKGGKRIGGKGEGKTGKGSKRYGYKGTGKGNNDGYYYNNYRSPGKEVGKGLNHMTEDWHNTWGPEGMYVNYWGGSE